MARRTCAAAALLIWLTGTAAAQPSSRSIQTTLSDIARARRPARSIEEIRTRVTTGDVLYVIDLEGESTQGTLAQVSENSLTLIVRTGQREFDLRRIKQIDRRQRDSVRNGSLIGLGSGALVGFLAGRAADSPSCPSSGTECGQGALIGAMGGAVWGAVGGWIADARIHKRDVIYLANGQSVKDRTEAPSSGLRLAVPASDAAASKHSIAQPRDAADTQWARVQALASGATIRVRLADGAVHQGTLQAEDDTSVTLLIGGQVRSLARAEIDHVSIARGAHRRRHIWIGLGIGAVTSGVAVALHCRGADASCKEAAPGYFYPMTAAGGVIGALLPRGTTWETLFSRAEP